MVSAVIIIVWIQIIFPVINQTQITRMSRHTTTTKITLVLSLLTHHILSVNVNVNVKVLEYQG